MKQLEKYCLISRKKFYIISIIVFVIGEIIGTILMMLPDEDDDAVGNPVVCAIIAAAVLVILWIFAHYNYITKPRKRFIGRLQYFQQQGLLNYVLSDIEKGVTKFNGNFLLGEYCVMGKGTGLIVFYNEIGSMYVKINIHTDDDGHTTETWELKIDAGGKTYTLCSVNKNAQSIQDWAEICAFLSMKAPNILIK